MPWTKEQVKTFNALSHGWRPKKGSLAALAGLGKVKLKAMAAEGVKPKKGKLA